MQVILQTNILEIIRNNILFVIATLLIVGAASSSVVKQASLQGYIRRILFMIVAAAPTYYVLRMAYSALIDNDYRVLVVSTGMAILTYLITRK